jgi:hypothetical protein
MITRLVEKMKMFHGKNEELFSWDFQKRWHKKGSYCFNNTRAALGASRVALFALFSQKKQEFHLRGRGKCVHLNHPQFSLK